MEHAASAPRPIEMVVFDIDGTLIVHPSGQVIWQLLNGRYGTPPAVNKSRFDAVLEGSLSYAEWVRLDIEDWQRAGATREDILAALSDFQLVPGADATLAELRSRGYRLAAVSGTLDILIDTIFPDHPFEQVFSNRISFDASGKIGSWQATPFDFDGKARALGEIARDTGIALERMAFVGDDVNDVDAARAAGLSVAYRPRSDALAQVCDVVIQSGSLEQILTHLP